jgi:hypothetical protein
LKEYWSIENEIGFESSTFEVQLKILSHDTTITKDFFTINNILLLEQRDWIDVGGVWQVQYFGFDKSNRLVFSHKLVESPSGTEIYDIGNYLVLDKFIPAVSFEEIEHENWESKNSPNAKRWLFLINDIDTYPNDNQIIDNPPIKEEIR